MYYKNVVRKSCIKLLILGVVSLMYYGTLSATTYTLNPSNNGDASELTGSDGNQVDNYALVNDGSNATYVYNDNTASWKKDLYDLPDDAGSGTINHIKVFAVAKRDEAASCLNILIQPTGTGGTIYESGEIDIGTTYDTYSYGWQKNPADNQTWEWTDINNLNVGISLCKNTGMFLYLKTYCSQVYVEVYVNPSPATYYVEKTGDDANGGTNSTTDAWLTIGKAAEELIVPGDIVYVSPGTYTENEVTPKNEGSSVSPISYIAVGDVTLDATCVTDADGFDITNNYIKIEGFKITNAGGSGAISGIKASGTGIVISENSIYDNTWGIIGDGATNLTISNNSIHSNFGYGIYKTGSNSTISNNLIYSNTGNGIQEPGDDSEITNNTIYDNGSGGYGILILNTATGITISNNIITDHSFGIDCKSSTPTLSYNDVWNNTTNCLDCPTGTENISTDPLFVSTTVKTLDFHLKSYYDTGGENKGTYKGGKWGANAGSGTWTAYAGECSPCIDAGNPADDWSNETEPDADRINMGVFGNTAQASRNCLGITAVELASFGARPEKNYILLNWITEAEIDNDKWLIKRSETKDADYKQITKLHAQGVPNTYIYIDSLITPGQTYWYKLGDVDKSGSITWHGPVLAKAGHKIKFSFSLKNPAANPSTGKVKLEYSIPGYQGDEQRPVTLKIYNISGQVVKTLVDERQKPGHYTIWWEGKNDRDKKVGSGTYFCHFKANGELVRKLIRIK